MSEKTVFISYSHDSDEHREKVLALSERLRDDGIETLLDQYMNGAPVQGWPRWMLDQLDVAAFVLVVCTETYYRRFRGHEVPGKGKGVDWEGALITTELYDACSRTLKFVPVFLSEAVEEHIPEPLRAGTHYALTSEVAYQRLYDFLLQQSGVEARPVGALKTKPRRFGSPLTFDEHSASPAPKIDISRIVKYAPVELIGRDDEKKLLSEAWDKAVREETNRPHVVTFVALGGEGKTSLVAKWVVDEMLAKGWPGCDAVFAWSFYSQGTREQTAVSSDLFLAEALTFFGDEAMAKSAAGAFDKGRRLAQLVGARRALLILDGLEPLQYAPTSPTPGELKDQGLAALLKGLAATSHGLCVVTTRYALPDLRAFHGQTVREEKLTRLARAAGVLLLKAHGVTGSDRPNLPFKDGDERSEMLSEFEKLVEDVDGHALTLHLLGSYLCDAHGGDIRKVGLVKLEEANPEVQGGHAFHVMDAYVAWLESSPGLQPVARPEGRTRVAPSDELKLGTTFSASQRALALLRLMGLFDRPATADCLGALWKAPAIAGLTEPLIGLSDAQRNIALKRLEDARLLTVNRDAAGTPLSHDAHPLLREYFAARLKEEGARQNAGSVLSTLNPQLSTFQQAHQRLYEHLCATTKDQPDATLEDLQPLYQAVAHGCQAGLQQEACDKVFRDRIMRGPEAYTLHKLGVHGSDLGAIACFFEQTWSRISPALIEPAQAWLLNEAAFRLRALGRLTEALEPMRVSGEMDVKVEQWKGAAISYSNLSELELTLGEVAGAVGDAEQSVTYADRSGDAFLRMNRYATHADALHQAGRRAEAEARFREAEQMQAERQPDYPLLYSARGFKYCDLLLTEGEREAGKATLECASPLALWQERSDAVGATAERDSHGSPATAPPPPQSARGLAHSKALRAVSERGAKMFEWRVPGDPLLDIALDHLTLGRAALYAAVLSADTAALSSFSLPTSHLSQSVSGLRRAGTQHYLPLGLLTRAWQRSLTGWRTGPESAQSDLDEAWEIAARGPMPLFLADIHLYRARLFGPRSAERGTRKDEAAYPWDKHPDGTPRGPKDDLAEARRLIVKHGYLRRLQELTDAEDGLAN